MYMYILGDHYSSLDWCDVQLTVHVEFGGLFN